MNSATTIPCGVDVLVEQDGKWYKPVTAEYAFSVRMDVPLFVEKEGKVRPSIHPPATHRLRYELDTRLNHQSPFVYLHPAWGRSSWYVEVDDPNKPEYEPCDSPSPS